MEGVDEEMRKELNERFFAGLRSHAIFRRVYGQHGKKELSETPFTGKFLGYRVDFPWAAFTGGRNMTPGRDAYRFGQKFAYAEDQKVISSLLAIARTKSVRIDSLEPEIEEGAILVSTKAYLRSVGLRYRAGHDDADLQSTHLYLPSGEAAPIHLFDLYEESEDSLLAEGILALRPEKIGNMISHIPPGGSEGDEVLFLIEERQPQSIWSPRVRVSAQERIIVNTDGAEAQLLLVLTGAP